MLPHLVFPTFALAGALWFVLAKRRTDFFTVAYFAGIIYFMPGFAGVTVPPHSGEQGFTAPVPMYESAYWVMLLVLGAIAIGAMLFDAFASDRPQLGPILHGGSYSPAIATFLAGIALVFMVMSSGSALLVRDKHLLLKNLGYFYYAWSFAMALAAVLCATYRRHGLFWVIVPMIFLDLYFGMRQTAALVFISIAVVWMDTSNRQRLIIVHWRKALTILAGGFFFFFFVAIKVLMFTRVDLALYATNFSNPLFYTMLISRSEPFGVQNTLSEVLRSHFHVGMGHLMGIIYQFVPGSPSLGAQLQSFNDLFQPALFPGVDYGLGSNVWAEMWSAGGNWLLVLFVLLYVGVLALGSYLVRSGDNLIKAGVVLFMSYWAFYIHRNDVLTQIGLQKRIVIIWLAVAAVSMLVPAFASGRRAKFGTAPSLRQG